jgi:hypothetical protein
MLSLMLLANCTAVHKLPHTLESFRIVNRCAPPVGCLLHAFMTRLMCLGKKFDIPEVPDLSVSGDNSNLVEDDPCDPTTTSKPEAPMQSLNQLPVVTDLAC